MNFPSDLKYTRDHEWVKVSGNVATIGITHFAQGELGDIVYVDISRDGETVNAEEIFGTVEAVKTVSDLFMPVSGKIIEVNKGLEQTPAAVNKDPYGTGWMIKVEMTDPSQAEKLMTADEYKSMVAA